MVIVYSKSQENLLNNDTSKNQWPIKNSIISNGDLINLLENWNKNNHGKDIFIQNVENIELKFNSTYQFNNDQQAKSTNIQINTCIQYDQSAPKIATLSDGGFVIVWQSWKQDGSDNGIYAQKFDYNSARVGNEFQVNTYTKHNQDTPAITGLSDGGFVIVWQSWKQDGSDNGIYAQKFDYNRAIVGNEFQVNT